MVGGLVTGATRTGEGLHAAEITYKVIPATCQLCNGGIVEDLEHIIWMCPHEGLEQHRGKFRTVLGKLARDAPAAEEQRITREPLLG